MDFFLSDEVQLLYAAAGFVGVTGGLEARMTPEDVYWHPERY